MPSLNASNCWDTPKPALHNVAGNGKRDGLRSCGMSQRAISNEATKKLAERSSTKESNLPLQEMMKSSRMGRFVLLAWFLIASSTFLPPVVMANAFFPILQEEKTRYSQNLLETVGRQDKEPVVNILLIKKKGDTVVINTLPDIDISDYDQNSTITWQVLAGGKVELKVNRAKNFAIRLDDVTLAQLGDNTTLDKWTKHGGEKMRIAIDKAFLADVYLGADALNIGATAGVSSGGYNVGATGSAIPLTKANITEYIAMCAAVADEQNWPKQDRWMVIPTWAKYLLNTSELKDASITGATTSFMTNGGYFKNLYDFDLFETNLYTPISDTGASCYNITFGHKSGITFAAQLTDMEYHDKFENTFGKGMKGLQIFDWKVINPKAVGVLYARKG